MFSYDLKKNPASSKASQSMMLIFIRFTSIWAIYSLVGGILITFATSILTLTPFKAIPLGGAFFCLGGIAAGLENSFVIVSVRLQNSSDLLRDISDICFCDRASRSVKHVVRGRAITLMGFFRCLFWGLLVSVVPYALFSMAFAFTQLWVNIFPRKVEHFSLIAALSLVSILHGIILGSRTFLLIRNLADKNDQTGESI